MNLFQHATSAVQGIGKKINTAFEKLLGNELAQRHGNPNLEGEGSYEGTRRYNSGVQDFVSKGRAPDLANEANQALDGPEAKSLRDAEAAGKRGPRPAIPRPNPKRTARDGRP